MSTVHLLDPTPRVGGFAMLAPAVGGITYRSADGSGVFAGVGSSTDWVMIAELAIEWLLDDGTEVDEDNDWVLGVGTDTNNRLSVRLNPDSSNQIRVYLTVGGASVGPLSIQLTDLSGVDPEARCSGHIRIAIRREGDTLSLSRLYQEAETPYRVHTVSVTDPLVDSLDLSSLGELCLGDGFVDHTGNSVPTALGCFYFGALGVGETMASLGLDSDAGVALLLVDPHGFLSSTDGQWGVQRSYDWVHADGSPLGNTLPVEVVDADYLKDIYGGPNLIRDEHDPAAPPVQALAPHGLSYSRPPVALAATSGRAEAVSADLIIAPGAVYGTDNHFHRHLRRLSPTTGRDIAPPIPLPDAGMRVDSSDVEQGIMWGMEGVSESHSMLTAVFDRVRGVVTVTQRAHSVVTGIASSAYPGDSWIECGWEIDLADGVLPSYRLVARNDETGTHRGLSYQSPLAWGGAAYNSARSSSTDPGKAVLTRRGEGDAEAARITLTAEATTSSTAAGFSVGACRFADGWAAFGWAVRNSGSTGYAGLWLVFVNLAKWGSQTESWIYAADGSDVTADLDTLAWDDARFFPVPGPAKDQLVAGAWDVATLAYDQRPVIDSLHASTKSGETVITACVEHSPDPQRDDDYPIWNDLALHRWRVDWTSDGAPSLTHLSERSLWANKQIASPGSNPINTILLDVERSIASVALVDGDTIVLSVPDWGDSWDAADLPAGSDARWAPRCGLIVIDGWWGDEPTIRPVAAALRAEDYGAVLIQPFRIVGAPSHAAVEVIADDAPGTVAGTLPAGYTAMADLSSHVRAASSAADVAAAVVTSTEFASVLADLAATVAAQGVVGDYVEDIQDQVNTVVSALPQGGELAAASTVQEMSSRVEELLDAKPEGGFADAQVLANVINAINAGVTISLPQVNGGSTVGEQLEMAAAAKASADTAANTASAVSNKIGDPVGETIAADIAALETTGGGGSPYRLQAAVSQGRLGRRGPLSAHQRRRRAVRPARSRRRAGRDAADHGRRERRRGGSDERTDRDDRQRVERDVLRCVAFAGEVLG